MEYRVYVIGATGNIGTKKIIEEKRDDLKKHFSISYLDKVLSDCENSIRIFDRDSIRIDYMGGLYPLLDCNENVIDMIEIGKGGFLTALWDICERNKWGLRYNLRKVPILQGTIEIANYYNINPYRLFTKNAYVVIVKEEIKGDKDFLETNFICLIGNIDKTTKKRIRVDGETESFLIKDHKDEIDKIIEKKKCLG